MDHKSEKPTIKSRFLGSRNIYGELPSCVTDSPSYQEPYYSLFNSAKKEELVDVEKVLNTEFEYQDNQESFCDLFSSAKKEELVDVERVLSKKFESLNNQESIRYLFDYVQKEQYLAVERLLQKNPDVMSETMFFKDRKKRRFESISPFLYALWACNNYKMIDLMLECLPRNAHGREIATTLKAQYKQAKEEGVTYTIHGKRITVRHIGFSVLKESMSKWFVNQEPNQDKKHVYLLLRQNTSALPENPTYTHFNPWSTSDLFLLAGMCLMLGNTLRNVSNASFSDLMVILVVAFFTTRLFGPDFKTDISTQFKKSGFLEIAHKLDMASEADDLHCTLKT